MLKIKILDKKYIKNRWNFLKDILFTKIKKYHALNLFKNLIVDFL